jgi:hypothetical protein
MKQADQIRTYARDTYVVPARAEHEKRFTIRTGDVVRGMKLALMYTPAVCSALKTKRFLQENDLCLISKAGPPSGQTTTVTYTYEFANPRRKEDGRLDRQEAWERLRGALRDVYAEYGGGEAYLRAVRASFRDADDPK